MAGRCDTGGAMHVDADVALVRDEWSPGVQADAHLDRARRECFGQLGGGSKGGGRSLESEEERVTLRIDLNTVVIGAGLAYDSPVPCKCLGVPVISQLVQELRRPLDVGEEERDGPGRKVVAHGA
jgi:hypothetical protein